ncbi:MAG: hypothetical protein ACTTG8_00740 [Catonella sp.]|uniref:hypothetical protein n=1 Tax=Catonella sp. TaxID=2382125 RepID=UPI003FA03B22
MSYFDSPKNKAIWERELRELRKEKKKREENGYKPERGEVKAVETNNPFRKKITFLELEASVNPPRKSGVKSRQHIRAAEKDKSLKNPEIGRSL